MRSERALPAKYGWLAALLVLGGFAVVVAGFSEERHFAAVVLHANARWLVVLLAAQAATYVCLTRLWAGILRRTEGSTKPPPGLIRLALAELFTDQAVPSGGVGGSLFVINALEQRGVSRAGSSAAVVVSLLGFYGAQLFAVLGALAWFALRGELEAFVTVVTTIAIGAAAITPLLTATAAKALSRLPRRVRNLPFVRMMHDAIESVPRDLVRPASLARAAAWRLAILLLDGATLAASLAAIGHPIPLPTAWAVFVVASTAASISFLPGGLGGFEVLSTALLVALEVPLEGAAAAVLLTRGFSFWLPMLPGLWFTRTIVRPPGATRSPST